LSSYWSPEADRGRPQWWDRVRLRPTPYCGVEPVNVKRGLYRLYPRTENETLNKLVLTGAAQTVTIPLQEECRIRKIGYALTGSDPTVLSENELDLAFSIQDNDDAHPWCLWRPDVYAQTSSKKFADGYEEPARFIRIDVTGTLNDRLYSFIDVMVVSE